MKVEIETSEDGKLTTVRVDGKGSLDEPDRPRARHVHLFRVKDGMPSEQEYLRLIF